MMFTGNIRGLQCSKEAVDSSQLGPSGFSLRALAPHEIAYNVSRVHHQRFHSRRK